MTNMNMKLDRIECLAGIAAVLLLGAAEAHSAEAVAGPDSSQIRPAMLLWSVGINSPNGATGLVETITRATFRGRPTWRVTHYAHDPTASTTNEFDLYDVDAETLSPLRSVMLTPAFEVELTFGEDRVILRRKEEGDNVVEHVPLSAPVMAEGPGAQVFVGSLPLHPEYELRYRAVDRWSGKAATRVKRMTLSVLDRRVVATAIGEQDVFEILVRPDDDSFRIVELVRAQPPHYALRTEYIRGKDTLVSEVTALAIHDVVASGAR